MRVHSSEVITHTPCECPHQSYPIKSIVRKQAKYKAPQIFTLHSDLQQNRMPRVMNASFYQCTHATKIKQDCLVFQLVPQNGQCCQFLFNSAIFLFFIVMPVTKSSGEKMAMQRTS